MIGTLPQQSAAHCRQAYAARVRLAWGDCEEGTVIPSSRSIDAKMGTFSEVPIFASQAVDTLSTACGTLPQQSAVFYSGKIHGDGV